MRTLNIKLSLDTYNLLCDNGQLNPPFVKEILYLDNNFDSLPELSTPTVNYALKVDIAFHLHLKRCALEKNMTLTELSGRLFENNYNRR